MTRAEALALLGLPEDASRADADRRFRDLAKRHHPDAAPGDPGAAARFARLAAARDRLRDPAPDPQPTPTPPPTPAPSPAQAPARSDLLPLLHLPADTLLAGGEAQAEIRRPCPACGGTGWRRIRLFLNLLLPCPACEGRGEERRTIRIRIPKGLPPDALVEISGRLHRVSPLLPDGLGRDGPHLTAERRLRPGAFRRGTRIACDLPGGRIRARVPPGTTPGATLRIPGRGLPDGHGGRGDLRIRLLARA